MRKLLPLFARAFFVVVFVSTSIFAQSVSPPRAAGYVYESEANGFKITFPGKPKETFSDRDSSFGKSRMTNVMFTNLLAEYSVVTIDFPTIMNDKSDLDMRFDMMRDFQANKPGFRVAKDAQFNFGSHYGREFVFESINLTISGRVIVAGPRMFYIAIGTKGRMSTQSEKLRSSNAALVERFFGSFQITEVATAKVEAVNLPDDFGVNAEKDKFSSSFFGITLTPPETWVSIPKEQVDVLFELGKEMVGQERPKLAERMTESNTRALAIYANKPMEVEVPSAMMFVLAERAPYPNFVPLSVAKTYQMAYLDKGEKVTVQPSTTRFGNIDFGWIETVDSATSVYNRIYFANVKGVVFQISMTYSSQAELRMMLSSIATISQNLTVTSK